MNYDYDHSKIINSNRENCSDCQVVTAVNAYYILTGNVIEQSSDEYYELVSLAKAKHGPAICIDKVWEKLGIETFDEYHSLPYMKITHPTECAIWYKRCGFHSVLIYDHEPKCNAFRVSNLKWLTTHDGWIFREDLDQILRPWSQKEWETRAFRLAGQ